MSEIPAILVVPAQLAGTRSSQAPTSTAARAVSSVLSGLQSGSYLVGVIAGRDAQGRPLLRTPEGQFALASRHAFPVGSRVTLELLRVDDRLEAKLVAPGQPSITQKPAESTAPPRAEPPADTAQAKPQPGAVAATVVGRDAEGRPLVQTERGEFALASHRDEPAGGRADLQPYRSAAAVEASSVATPRSLGERPLPQPGQGEASRPVRPDLLPGHRVTLELTRADHRIEARLIATDRSGAPLQRGLEPSSLPARAELSASGKVQTEGRITGEIVGRNPEGRALVRTERGEFALAGREMPQVGRRVTLDLARVGGAIEARLVTPAPSEHRLVESIRPTPAAETTPIAKGPQAGERLVGVVSGRDANHRPVLRTPYGEFTLSPRLVPSAGQTDLWELVRLDPLAAAPPPIAAPSLTPTPAPARPAPAGDMRMWGSFLRALQTAGPEKLEGSAIPRIGGNLATSILAFVSALRAGDLAMLLGQEAARLLDDPVHQLLAKELVGDLRTLERPLVESGSGSWRALFVPLLDGQDLHQIRFFMRRRDRSREDDKPESDTERFVVETELGATGPLQLDGLIGQDRFDLIIRTQTPLPPAWRDDIRRIFEEAGELTGARGGLSFQAVPEFPVKPLEEDPALGGGVLA